jgi:hypothetical protein
MTGKNGKDCRHIHYISLAVVLVCPPATIRQA